MREELRSSSHPAHAAARCAVAYSLSHVARLCTAVGCGCGVEGNEEARPAPRRAQVLLVVSHAR